MLFLFVFVSNGNEFRILRKFVTFDNSVLVGGRGYHHPKILSVLGESASISR